jgi:prepilin-type N-terminal cleavage/methylation domain-containing protein
MKLNRTQKNGFTLVEIMIVVGIIGLLAAIAIPNFIRYREASRRSVCIANLKQLNDAKIQWGMERGKKATAIPVEEDLIGPDAYIRIKPSCPSEGDDYFMTIGDLRTRAACSLGSAEGHSL